MAATSPTVSQAARNEVRPWADNYDARSGLQCYVLSFLAFAPTLEDAVAARRHAKFRAPPSQAHRARRRQAGGAVSCDICDMFAWLL